MKKKTNWQRIKKAISPKNLIILIILFLGNSFAWFIYATQVDNEMSAHVRAWDVLFQSGDSPIVNYVDVNVESMFPGMEEFLYELKAHNRSEVGASVKYTILEARIIDTEYITKEGRGEKKEPANPADLTSAQLVTKLLNDYPFIISFNLSNEELAADIGIATYEIRVNWPFESGDDEADTLWGVKAANFKTSNPTEPSIKMKIKISIAQSLEP